MKYLILRFVLGGVLGYLATPIALSNPLSFFMIVTTFATYGIVCRFEALNDMKLNSQTTKES